MAMPDLTPYMRQDSAVRNDFAQRTAANTFGKTRQQTQGAWGQQDFTRGFQRSLPKFSASFAQRGLAGPGAQSGVMRRAMSDYLGDYTRNLGRMQQTNFDELQQFDFNQSRFEAERDRALADIEGQKAALIANTANQIAALRPYMGGS